MSKFAIPLRPAGIVIKIVVIVLALAFIQDRANAYKSVEFVVGDAAYNVAVVFAFWAALLAPGFYLCALWPASDVFARMSKGDAFGPAMTKGLRGMGLNLMMGAFAALVFSPTLIRFVETHFRSYGLHYHVEIESLTIGLLGIVLYMLAKQGQALKSELEKFV